ncbi:MAG: GspE/PulE family protein [bacterium]|nr:GspE/PulE family protein [bacterium]
MDKNLEDILFEDKILSREQLEIVRSEHINTGEEVKEILLRKGFATVLQIAQAKAKLVGIPYISLEGRNILPEVLRLVTETVAAKYLLIPFEFDAVNGTISLAMSDPLDLQVIDFIEKKSKFRVKAYLGATQQIKTAIKTFYAQNLGTEVTRALEETPETKVKEAGDRVAPIITTDQGVTKIVSALLEFAIKSRASDIHIEPLEDKTRIRYRIDGILYEKLTLPVKIHDSIVARIKILAELKIDEKRIPQDGRFNFKINDDEVDLRVSTLPTVYGEKVVIRLLKKSGGVPTLQELGLRGTALRDLEVAMLRPHGIIIVCGPTGSGKTTTLYSVLTKINSSKVNIMTLEDPVEYQMAGVNQVQINVQAGLTFASGLRSFLRQDPNIILVGEIRDDETTELAIQAALTGHLVFSTLHTNNAAGALPRLLDLHAEPFLIASSMNALIGQRICRKICNTCKESYSPPEEISADIKKILGKLFDSQKYATGVQLFRGKGCADCGQTGYTGRVGIFEVLSVSEKISQMVLERASATDIENKAVEAGMITMKQDGYLKAVEGVTTLEEVLRVAQD